MWSANHCANCSSQSDTNVAFSSYLDAFFRDANHNGFCFGKAAQLRNGARERAQVRGCDLADESASTAGFLPRLGTLRYASSTAF
jgi:hypothetical protein